MVPKAVSYFRAVGIVVLAIIFLTVFLTVIGVIETGVAAVLAMTTLLAAIFFLMWLRTSAPQGGGQRRKRRRKPSIDAVAGPPAVTKKRDGANIALAIIILSYILLKIIFSFNNVMVFTLGFMILLGIVAGSIAYYKGALRETPLVKSIGALSFLDFLSPENPDDAFSLLKIYAISGAIVLSFSLVGPWFVFEENWGHDFDSFLDTEYGDGELLSSRYGLSSVKHVTYDYNDWGSYDTDAESIRYDEVNGFQNRLEVGSKARNMVILAVGVWIVSSIAFLYFIYNELSNTNPRINSLREIKHIQERISLFSEKLERLKRLGIDISSFSPAIEKIEQSKDDLEFKTSVSKSIPVFAYGISGIGAISLGIAVFACIQFGGAWADAMHSEDGVDDGTCAQCSLVDSFTGSAYETQDSGSGTYRMFIDWGGGWGREIILWLGTLIFLGVLRNSITLINLSKAALLEISGLEETVRAFSMPEL
jgi:hypothetical protein